MTEKAKRRSFTVEFNRRIVKETDACKAPVELELYFGAMGCTPRIRAPQNTTGGDRTRGSFEIDLDVRR